MLFRIKHKTTYKYTKEVFLEPHTVRLRPRNDHAQKLQEFRMTVVPEPTGSSTIIDTGGDSSFLWFDNMTGFLVITTESVVRTVRVNPFDFILADERSHSLPMEYTSADKNALSPYRSAMPNPGREVEAIIAEELLESGADTFTFLTGLNARIYNDFTYTTRNDGGTNPPEQTALSKSGTCRDYVVLFNEACRSLGLAARFVSGYTSVIPDSSKEAEDMEHDLHAWSEIYLPGGGWRGFDPTLGLAVSNSHVALYSGVLPQDASPVSGTFRGTGASAEMEYEIEIVVE